MSNALRCGIASCSSATLFSFGAITRTDTTGHFPPARVTSPTFLIIKWPGVSRARRVIGEPVISNDLYPTCLSAAGNELNPNQHMDGVNWKPLLSETDELPRASLFWVLAFAPLQ